MNFTRPDSRSPAAMVEQGQGGKPQRPPAERSLFVSSAALNWF